MLYSKKKDVFYKMFPKLKTERLVLRAYKLSDADRLANFLADGKIAKNTALIPSPYTKDMAIAWLKTLDESYLKQELIVFAVVLQKSGNLIGSIGLSCDDKFASSSGIEIGYWIGEKYWNNGYCTEAVKEVLKYAFSVLKVKKISAEVFKGNDASAAVLVKMGMAKSDKTQVKYFEARNRKVEVITYSISAEKYLKLGKKKDEQQNNIGNDKKFK